MKRKPTAAPPRVVIDAEGFPHIISSILDTAIRSEQRVSRVLYLRLVCRSWNVTIAQHVFGGLVLVFRSKGGWKLFTNDLQRIQHSKRITVISDKLARQLAIKPSPDPNALKGTPLHSTRVLQVVTWGDSLADESPWPLELDALQITQSFVHPFMPRLKKWVCPRYTASAHTLVLLRSGMMFSETVTVRLPFFDCRRLKRIVVHFDMATGKRLGDWPFRHQPPDEAVHFVFIRVGNWDEETGGFTGLDGYVEPWRSEYGHMWQLRRLCRSLASLLQLEYDYRITIVNVPPTWPDHHPNAGEDVHAAIVKRAAEELWFKLYRPDIYPDTPGPLSCLPGAKAKISFLTLKEYAATVSTAQFEYETKPLVSEPHESFSRK